MRRFQALIFAAGLAAAPAGAAATPSQPNSTGSPPTIESFEWSASKGRLGVMVMSLTPELRKHLGAAEDRGALVARVSAGSPAAAAGIAVGDVIVDVAGCTVAEASDVRAALAQAKKGERLWLQIVRDRKPQNVQVTVADDAPASRAETEWLDAPWFRDFLGPFFSPKQAAAGCKPSSSDRLKPSNKSNDRVSL